MTAVVPRPVAALPPVYRAAFFGFIVLMLLVAVSGFAWVTAHHVDYATTPGAERDEVPDYVSFYAAGALVRDGQGDRLYDLDAVLEKERDVTGNPIDPGRVLPYFNPPFVAVLLAPLTALSLPAFGAALGVVNALLFVGCGVAMQRLLSLHRPRHAVFFWLAYGSSVPLLNVYFQQQLTLWVMAGWLGFVTAQLRGEHRLSGAALALGLVKPQLVVLPLLYLVCRRQWAALGSFGAIAGALVLVSIAAAGPGVLTDYPRFLFESTGWEEHGIKPFLMYGWNGLLADLLNDSTPPRLLFGGLCVATLGLVAITWRRASSAERLPELMAVALLASLLISAHLYLHDIALAGLAIVFVAAASARRSGVFGRWGIVAAGLWFASLPLFSYEHGPPLLSLAMAGLFGALWSNAIAGKVSAAETVALPEDRLAA